jgi:SIR2-like domain/TIR domain
MTNPIPTLTSHLAAGRLALFLGADLPAALTGLPARADLARGLAERHGLDPALRLAAAAQRVMQGGNRFEFTDYLGRQLDSLGRQPGRFHQLLVHLPARAIVTTAYDSMLELAFQQAGEPLNILVRDSDVAFADPQRRTLVKLYGDVRQRDTLIVTEDDHNDLWRSRDKESLLNEVRSILSRHTLLFLGYDLADLDFNLLWRELLDRMGRFVMGAYAVWPGALADERRVWEGRQVQMIDEQPLEFLERLVAAASGGPAGKPGASTQTGGAVIGKRGLDQMSQQPPQPQATAGYDAFISYSSKDSAWVRGTLLPGLERAGLRVCIDYRDFAIGVPILENIEQAIDQSSKTLLVLTPNWVASEWTAFESLLLQTNTPAGWGQRILPLRVQPCELPRRLKIFTYLDLTDPAELDFQFDRLVQAIRPSVEPLVAVPAVPEPMAAQPASVPVPAIHAAVAGFSYERGLAALRQRLEHADDETHLAFTVLETRLRENLRDDRLYGSTETIRNERARISYELNRLALNQAGPSFNELCGG